MTPFSTPHFLPPLATHLTVMRGSCTLVFDDITSIKGQGSYTLFQLQNGQTVLTSKSLSFYSDKLPAHLLRVHKTYFVNLLFVKAFDGNFVYLTDGRCIPVSRRRRRTVRKMVHLPSTF